MPKSSGPTKQDLLNVLKQAVADCCSIAPEDVRVNEDGYISVDNRKGASSALLLCVDMKPHPCIIFQAILLRGISASPQLYQHLNRINLTLPVGTIYFEEESIDFFYKLPTSKPSADLIAWLIRVVTELIDDHDDSLQRALGGYRWADEDREPAPQGNGQSLGELMLYEIDQASNDCNDVMMSVIANYLSDEEIAEYAEVEDEDKAFILEQLHLMLHSSQEQFQDYFRGYYGTPDNNFHAEMVEEGALSMSQDEFFEQLDWQEILTLCRRHCDPETVASLFRTLTGADYSSERERFPVKPWDGKPQWEMVDGQYMASE